MAYMQSHVSYVHALARVDGFTNVTGKDWPQWPVSAPFYEPFPLLSLTTGTGFSDQTSALPSARETWSPGIGELNGCQSTGSASRLLGMCICMHECTRACARVCVCVPVHWVGGVSRDLEPRSITSSMCLGAAECWALALVSMAMGNLLLQSVPLWTS